MSGDAFSVEEESFASDVPAKNDYSRSLVIMPANLFSPSIIQLVVGGAYDPLTYLMPMREIMASKFRKQLLKGMRYIMEKAFSLHQPREVLVVTDYSDDQEEVLRVVTRMVREVQTSECLEYDPQIRHLHVDVHGEAKVDDDVFQFTRRKARRVIIGCIDPRLARVRSKIEDEIGNETSWFTVPGCLYFLNKTSDFHSGPLRRWIRENLRYAKGRLHTTSLKICPHEDCKAHPVKVEISGRAEALRCALTRRVVSTERAIRCLESDPGFQGFKYQVVGISLGLQPLAIRKVARGGKKGVVVQLMPP